jgi:hypothetical protein
MPSIKRDFNLDGHNVRFQGGGVDKLTPERRQVYDFARNNNLAVDSKTNKNDGFIFDGPTLSGDVNKRNAELAKHGITNAAVIDGINHIIAGTKGGFEGATGVEVHLEKINNRNVVVVHGTDKNNNEFAAYLNPQKDEEYLRASFHSVPKADNGGYFEFYHA